MASFSNPDLSFYVVDTKGCLVSANLTFIDEHFELKIEGPDNTGKCFGLGERFSWRMSSLSLRSASSVGSNTGPYINKILPLSVIKDVRWSDFEQSFLNKKALNYLRSLSRSQNKIKFMRIYFGEKFNLTMYCIVLAESQRIRDEGFLIFNWVNRLISLIKRAKSLNYFDRLRLWYLNEYRKVSLESLTFDRLEVWKNFLGRSHHGISTELFLSHINSIRNFLVEYNPNWMDSHITHEEFCLTARQFLQSIQTISIIFPSFIADFPMPELANPDNPADFIREFGSNSRSVEQVIKIICSYFVYIRDNSVIEAEIAERETLPKAEVDIGIQDDISTHARNMIRRFMERFQPLPVPDNLKYSSQALLDYIFSDKNSIWDPKHLEIYQDMSKPLSFYWINSSHNTYLTGDQLSSKSSVETYARALRQGCRCIEIDVADGELQPKVTHVGSFTTSVLLKDVLNVIKENAFCTSKYPVIISVENHCSPNQQKKMAKLFRTTFGKDLLTLEDSLFVNKSNSEPLPSPEDLLYKIIIKGKKISWVNDKGNNEESIPDHHSCDCLLTGELWRKSENNGIWKQCIFVLTNTSLFYTDKRKSVKTVDLSVTELHGSQEWFYHTVTDCDQKAAENLLIDNKDKILVWHEGESSENYMLSFYGTNKANHLKINKFVSGNQNRFYLKESQMFSRVDDLIEYYKGHPLEIHDYLLEHQEWFYKNMDDARAEKVLQLIPLHGAFLARYKRENLSEIVITFRFHNLVKHCQIKREEGWLMVSKLKFQTLIQLVDYYRENAFYMDMKLNEPIGQKLYNQCEKDVMWIYCNPDYVASAVKTQKSRARAIQSYESRDPKLLSFKKGDIITDIIKDEGGWWWGSVEDKIAEDAYISKQFCSSFVEEIVEVESPFGVGKEFKLGKAKIKSYVDSSGKKIGLKHYIQLKDHDGTNRFLGAMCSLSKVIEWVDMINYVIDKDEKRNTKIAKSLAGEKDNISPQFSDIITLHSLANRLIPTEIGEKSKICPISVKSLNENDGVRVFQSDPAYFVWYHMHALTRIYPKGTRLDSSNFSPIRLWNFGSQMAALNYQSSEEEMQWNRGKFRQNGNCGYVLKPGFMTNEEYKFDPTNLKASELVIDEMDLSVHVISARHLKRPKAGVINPLVQLEVTGVDEDLNKAETNLVGTGLNPYWDKFFEFKIKCPDLAMIRFHVYDVDNFGDKHFLGECTIPINCVREGYRSVQLYSGYGEPLLSTLLVNVSKNYI